YRLRPSCARRSHRGERREAKPRGHRIGIGDACVPRRDPGLRRHDWRGGRRTRESRDPRIPRLPSPPVERRLTGTHHEAAMTNEPHPDAPRFQNDRPAPPPADDAAEAPPATPAPEPSSASFEVEDAPAPPPPPRRRLARSRRDSVIGGVAGGFAEYFDADPTLVRLAFAVLAFITGGTFILVYIGAWIVMPEADETADA